MTDWNSIRIAVGAALCVGLAGAHAGETTRQLDLACSKTALRANEEQMRNFLPEVDVEKAMYVVRSLLCLPVHGERSAKFVKNHAPSKISYSRFPVGLYAYPDVDGVLVDRAPELVLGNDRAAAPISISVDKQQIFISYEVAEEKADRGSFTKRRIDIRNINGGWMIVRIEDISD